MCEATEGLPLVMSRYSRVSLGVTSIEFLLKGVMLASLWHCRLVFYREKHYKFVDGAFQELRRISWDPLVRERGVDHLELHLSD